MALYFVAYHGRFVFKGVAVGAGWQCIVAYVNITCYYLIGIPVGVVLGYVLQFQVKVSFFIFHLKFFDMWVQNTNQAAGRKKTPKALFEKSLMNCYLKYSYYDYCSLLVWMNYINLKEFWMTVGCLGWNAVRHTHSNNCTDDNYLQDGLGETGI